MKLKRTDIEDHSDVATVESRVHSVHICALGRHGFDSGEGLRHLREIASRCLFATDGLVARRMVAHRDRTLLVVQSTEDCSTTRIVRPTNHVDAQEERHTWRKRYIHVLSGP